MKVLITYGAFLLDAKDRHYSPFFRIPFSLEDMFGPPNILAQLHLCIRHLILFNPFVMVIVDLKRLNIHINHKF